MLQAARRARENMRPALAGWGCGRVEIGVNRRFGEALDDRAGLIKVTDAETGAPLAVILRLTAHGNSLKSDNRRYSPDWIGAARQLLTKEWGCPVLLTQGASGNVAPRYFDSHIDPRTRTTAADMCARRRRWRKWPGQCCGARTRRFVGRGPGRLRIFP